jgi:hypothetical protein
MATSTLFLTPGREASGEDPYQLSSSWLFVGVVSDDVTIDQGPAYAREGARLAFGKRGRVAPVLEAFQEFMVLCSGWMYM